MKMTKVLLSIAVLGLIMNLSASVRINGLGSYFEYLIPDTETDIELFPSHLSEFESRYVQVFNNYNSHNYDWYGAKNIHLSIMPLSRKLSIRINADIVSDDNEPRIYLNDIYSRRSTEFVGREYGASLVNNSLSYELTDSFHLGCFFKYGVNWKDIDDESLEIENSDLIIAMATSFIIAIFLILAILILQFNSYLQPAIIMYSLVVGILGANI
jgi:hypothetical protein